MWFTLHCISERRNVCIRILFWMNAKFWSGPSLVRSGTIYLKTVTSYQQNSQSSSIFKKSESNDVTQKSLEKFRKIRGSPETLAKHRKTWGVHPAREKADKILFGLNLFVFSRHWSFFLIRPDDVDLSSITPCNLDLVQLLTHLFNSIVWKSFNS